MNARRAALHAAFRDPPPGWVRVPEAPTLAIRWSREVEFPADHPMRGWPDLHGGKPYANWEPTYDQQLWTAKGDLNLFVDHVAAVFLGRPVEISQGCTGKCPDRRELRGSHMFALRECLQARHSLVAGREHNGDRALLAVRMQAPCSHRSLRFAY